MNVEPLGELTPDSSIPEWLVSAEVDVPYFPRTRLRFVLEPEDAAAGSAPPEFVTAAQNFLRLTVAQRAEATPWVFKNYAEFAEAVGEDDLDFRIDDPADVWGHVHPSQVHVSRRPYGDKKVYVQIVAECDWEQEHGLQIVYRAGDVLSRVSAQDGHLTHSDAYGLPESEDRIA